MPKWLWWPAAQVIIPFGWNLVIDESPPALGRLTIFGNVTFSATADVTLTAQYIVVAYRGRLTAGTPAAPHPARVTIALNGVRASPDLYLDKTLNLGSKVLAAVRNGTISLHGYPKAKRWTKVRAMSNGESSGILQLSEPQPGWRAGDQVVVTSTSFNTWQAEILTIAEVLSNGALRLNDTLKNAHGTLVKAYGDGGVIDMRAEVGLLSSNIVVTSDNGAAIKADGGSKFGARVVVYGAAVGFFTNIAIQYCGQYGIPSRACVLFDTLAPVGGQPNPSILRDSSVMYAQHNGVRVDGAGTVSPVTISGNVMYESYDVSTVDVSST